ncbi:MAG: PilX N-terminal domain-containing pilus assembly protein [Oleiphilaceae bacterium]|nr:PilX N-terminal domain-containing pilus assembly protein [Oleiphilaceae bacterium]
MSMRRQDGATLIMTLLILLIVSLLAISSAERTTLQDRMVVAQRDADIAFEMAEEALREAERLLSSGQITLEDFNSDGPLYSAGDAGNPFGGQVSWRAATETGSHWRQEAQYSNVADPEFFIESIGKLGRKEEAGDVMVAGREDLVSDRDRNDGFRIVARARGASGGATRVLEQYYGEDMR